MDLYEAIDIVLGANNGERPIAVAVYVKATGVILDAMREEITTTEMVKWCSAHRPFNQKDC